MAGEIVGLYPPTAVPEEPKYMTDLRERGTVRYYRDEVAALAQRVSDLKAPLTEGYRDVPQMVEDGLTRLEAVMDELDRDWAKVDRK